MDNFTYHNPVKLVFGRGTIANLAELVPRDRRVLLTYGAGSIRANGVYDQVARALKNHRVTEFGGIGPNPEYDHLVRALPVVEREKIDFLLAVGGGSVLDGTKFLALAAGAHLPDPWDIMARRTPVARALPLGAVLTIPGTGSEANAAFVISRRTRWEKLGRVDPLAYPAFAVLDPETTFSLPERQLANGIIDTCAHVFEQYLTADVHAPLQARQAEAILLTLVGEKTRIMQNPPDYQARATFTWCASQALNGLVSRGVFQDWTSHQLSHEVTALFGLDHGRALALVMPAVLEHQAARKAVRLRQYGERVWGIRDADGARAAAAAIEKTRDFFRSLGAETSLSACGIGPEAGPAVAAKIAARGQLLGEHGDLGEKEIGEIFALCR